MTDLEAPRLSLNDALDVLDDRSLDLPQRAALLAAAWQLKLLLGRRIALPQRELAEAFDRAGIRQLGPLVLTHPAKGVEWPCNAPENWDDASVQGTLADLHELADTHDYVRWIPAHYEVDTAALGAGVRDRVRGALELHREAKRHGWRTEDADEEGGRAPKLVLRP